MFSDFKPKIRLIPGKYFGIPFSPGSEPYLFMIFIASYAILGEEFKQFSFITSESKLSTPNAAIFPGVQYLTTAFVISWFLSLTTFTGFTLSMCRTFSSGQLFLMSFSSSIAAGYV